MRTLMTNAAINSTGTGTASVSTMQATGENSSGSLAVGNVVGSGTGRALANLGAQNNVVGKLNRNLTASAVGDANGANVQASGDFLIYDVDQNGNIMQQTLSSDAQAKATGNDTVSIIAGAMAANNTNSE